MFNQENIGPLKKLIRLSQSIANDQIMIEELIQEINDSSDGPICSIIKALFKKKLLKNISPFAEFLPFLFRTASIREVIIHYTPNLAIKCFFMPANTLFPLHNHSNKVVCSVILYGKVKYLTVNHTEGNKYSLSIKGMADVSKVMFCTLSYRNIHTILAIEDSIILDITMPNLDDDPTLFKVLKKRNREFLLEKCPVSCYKKMKHS